MERLGVRLGSRGLMVGGMLLSLGHPNAVTIGWLALSSDHRHGVGRALVEKAFAEAVGRPVRSSPLVRGIE